MPVIKIGGVDIEPAHAKPQRLSVLLWGVSGAGKTTLACTAPGRKLLVNFDPDGPASIANRTDVDIADLSDVSAGVVEQFKSQDNPLGIGNVLKEYDSIIVDSLTNAQHMAVMHAVTKTKGASIERPSMQGYGMRNALITQLVKNLLRVTGRADKHIIFTAHEAAPQLNDDGVVMSITMSLGGQLTTNAPIDFSEVYCVEDTGKTRRIAVRPSRARKPMKTRLFVTSGEPEFVWKHTGTELEDWYQAWKINGWKKIELPK
jgi:phage nucleotide-binding protein